MTKPIPEWCERAAREVAPVLVRHGDESQAAAIIAEEHEKGCIVHENQVNTVAFEEAVRELVEAVRFALPFIGTANEIQRKRRDQLQSALAKVEGLL